MYDHKELEGWSEKFWKDNKIYEKVKDEGKIYFEFIDGPPFVTGEIHPGTAWNKSIKDAILRFFRMRGYKVNDTPGFDTHGLPIEVKVEKKLGIENKSEIETKIGIENFVKECKDFAENYRKIMTEQLKSFHIWMDWENPYITFKKEYIERSWKTIKKAWEKGLLKEGDYVVPYCYRCQTTLANYELEYKNLKDPSIYVLFPTEDGRYLLIWTTTPWTLVANLAVMAHPNEVYLEVTSPDGKRVILAKARYEKMKQHFKDWKVSNQYHGSRLEGLRYKHPFDDLLSFKFDRKIVLSSEYVSMEEGTGLVHSAPGHGEEDYKVGIKYGLPTFSFVDDAGQYIDVGERFKGKVAREMNDEIIEILKNRGLLFRHETIEHSYPTCWRCKSPLIYRSTHQWFITITEFKDKMIEEAQKIKWVPEFAMKRFVNFLKDSPDWCISRQRYWGIPLPIWKCEKCGEVKIIDSLDNIEDPHRPYIDKITFKCEKCGGVMKRVPDVLDVWFDSGNAVWASTGRDTVADFIVEGQDQIRGWFYSLLGSGMIYYERSPYTAVAMHGFFVDEKGEKMSKSVGNYIPVEQILDRVGADAFRLFGLSNNIWEDLRFNWRDLELAKRELFVLINMVKYLEENEQKDGEIKIWDRWILAKLYKLKKLYIESFHNFEYYIAVRTLREFIIEDVSRFYMKLVKSGESSIKTLYTVLLEVLIMLAPIAPATSEYLYQKAFRKYEKEESIFMKRIEDVKEYDDKLIENMEVVQKVISEILEWRQSNKLPLRMPIAEIRINSLEGFEEVISIMTNAKIVKVGDVERTDIIIENIKIMVEKGEFKDEWLLNEISRRIQYFRKINKVDKDDVITLNYDGSEEIINIIENYQDELEKRTRTRLVRKKDVDGHRFEIKQYTLSLRMA